MEIDGSRIYQPSAPQRPDAVGGKKGDSPSERDTLHRGASETIRDRWEQLPDVRPEVVAMAKRALQAGELDSRETLEKTAARIAAELSPRDEGGGT